MALFVAAGAFGAHGLKDRLSEQALGWWETGARYHAWHAMALFVVDWLHHRGLRVRTSGLLMVAGLLLFSGSLYVMALTGQRWLGAVTPLGGTAWIIGWIGLAVAAARGHSASASR
jgi:uncharacterized membrane protein YgdD (TMEM256/DUF423 family)